jgi:hypothetical protein
MRDQATCSKMHPTYTAIPHHGPTVISMGRASGSCMVEV